MGKRISELPSATTLAGTEYIPIVQNGATVKTTPADLQTYDSIACTCVKYASVDIPTAQVLTLNSAPVQIVAAPGASKYIVGVRAIFQMTYNSIAYATNTNLQLLINSAATVQFSATGQLAVTANAFNFMTPATGGTISMVANEPLNVNVATGDPTAGNSDITVHVWYVILG